MTYVKTYLPTLKTHVVNLKRDAKDLSRDLQRLEVRGKLGSKTLFSYYTPLQQSAVTFTKRLTYKPTFKRYSVVITPKEANT